MSLKGISWYHLIALPIIKYVFKRCGCHEDIKHGKADHLQQASHPAPPSHTQALSPHGTSRGIHKKQAQILSFLVMTEKKVKAYCFWLNNRENRRLAGQVKQYLQWWELWLNCVSLLLLFLLLIFKQKTSEIGRKRSEKNLLLQSRGTDNPTRHPVLNPKKTGGKQNLLCEMQFRLRQMG